jgi:hypothetical protein
MRESFKRLPGDTSTYVLGDGEGAVRLARSAPFIAVDIETGSASTANRWRVSAVAIADEQQAFVLDPSDPGESLRRTYAQRSLTSASATVNIRGWICGDITPHAPSGSVLL